MVIDYEGNSELFIKGTEKIPWQEEEVALPAGIAGLPFLCDPAKFPLLVLLPTSRDVKTFASAWKQIWEREIFQLEPVPLDADSVKDFSNYVKRGETLKKWYNRGGVMVTTPGGIMGPLQIAASSFHLTKGEEVGKSDLVHWLAAHGYSRSDVVWAPGQFASRGFILDIYDPAHMYPIRVEFFDEDIEQIRSFRSGTQKSVATLPDIEIHSITGSSNVHAERLIHDDVRVLFYEASRLQNQGENYKWLWESLREPGVVNSIPDWTDIYLKLSKYPRIRIVSGYSSRYRTLDIDPPPFFRGNRNAFVHACRNWKDQGFRVILVSENETFGHWSNDADAEFHLGTLPGGFLASGEKLAVISDLELTGSTGNIRTEQDIQAPAEWTDSLSPGDHVIHNQHGVAVFRGLEQVSVNENITEMFLLEFADNKRLMMPIDHFYQLTPLYGIPGETISLDRLGGKKWKKSLERERERAREEAEKLTRNYARREVLEGFSFSSDNELTREFEKAFPFPETADQLRAIGSVKEDMEKNIPMDRLVVGDVGYGKTEVAMRAAFKAVQDGKQVAVLVPTTILTQQHYQTFLVRFAGFPVNIAFLSRFQSRREQQRVISELETGRIDIIVGTQRILQDDVNFRNLGLLVIDEEHRFGVSSKERLKKFNDLVDVLTLSATPIPRTLSMSMRSLKDLSPIKTPPENRMPVITFVGPWKKRLVEESVRRELTRGGQVFYVHNRVRTIERTATVIRNMFPDVVVDIAHGQMKEKDLEKVMYSFYEGKSSILVCTTIIESGLDVGNANTLIVDDSHEMGMAQMYQLRGRIGRRAETAYAFFLYPENLNMSRITIERLEAIASVNDPGGGYELALSDLAQRGSGDMFGLRQHGKKSSITSALYYKFLDEEVKKLKGQYYLEPEFDVELNTSIPENYIPQETVRIALYRRLMRATEIDEIDRTADEIRDRFGPLNENMKNLLEVCRLKIAARGSFIEKGKIAKKHITVYGPENELEQAFSGWKYWIVKNGKAVGPGASEGLVMLKSVILGAKQQ